MKRLFPGFFALFFLFVRGRAYWPGGRPTTPLAAEKGGKKAGPEHVPFIEGRPFAEILKKAKAEKKPVMIDVYAVWCGPCKLMDRTTFVDPQVIAWAKANVIPARFDAEKGEGRHVALRYAAFSFPTILFLDPDGNEIDRLLGAFGPEDFRKAGPTVLARQSPLLLSLDKLKKAWTVPDALNAANLLAQRHDVVRLRPIVIRLVTDDPDLSRPEILQEFSLLVSLEDFHERLSPETGDLLATFLPRLGTDPRRGILAAALVRDQARNGDAAGARHREDDAHRARRVHAVRARAPHRARHRGEEGGPPRRRRRRAPARDRSGGAERKRRRERGPRDRARGRARRGRKTAEAKAALAAGAELAAADARAQAKALRRRAEAAPARRSRRAGAARRGADAGRGRGRAGRARKRAHGLG